MAVELVGKRCLCVSGGERLELAGISRWSWRAGVIRACDSPALTVKLTSRPLFTTTYACFWAFSSWYNFYKFLFACLSEKKFGGTNDGESWLFWKLVTLGLFLSVFSQQTFRRLLLWVEGWACYYDRERKKKQLSLSVCVCVCVCVCVVIAQRDFTQTNQLLWDSLLRCRCSA